MRNNKLLIIFLLVWAIHTLSFSRTNEPQIVKGIITDSMLDNKELKRAAQMEHLYKTVSVDTTRHKARAFNRDFREKYLNDEEFIYNSGKGDTNFFKRILNKIGKFLKYLFGIGSISKVTDVTWLILKIISGIIILVVLYFIIRLFMNHKGKWLFQKKNESVSIDINDVEQLIKSADFEKLIAEVESRGDTRQSIRLFYLWLLKDLKDKGIIEWLPEKTNADYLSEIVNESLKKQFSYLSYLFNYIWYGEFSITDEDYISAKNAFLIHLKADKQNG